MMEKAQAINPEQAADLAALKAAANETQGLPATAPEAAASINLAGDIEGLLKVAVVTLSPMFPSLTKTYTPEVTQAAAGAIAAVCNKHGWMQGGMFGEYGEEIACLAIVGPLALTTYQGITQDMAEAKAKRKEKPQALSQPPAQTEGPKAVTFGAPAPVEARADD